MNKRVYDSVMSGRSDYNIRFSDFQNLIVNLGFVFVRQNGSHIMYYNPEIRKCMNIQKDGSKAKAYEVKQLRKLIEEYNLGG